MGVEFKQVYQYRNCNVYDLWGESYHGDRLIKKQKFRAPFLLRVGLECLGSERMENVYGLLNCVWSLYQYVIPNSSDVSISNKVLFLGCQSVTANIGLWRLEPHLIQLGSVRSMEGSHLFTCHFMVSSATLFVTAYLMGMEWSEVLETCFLHSRFGDLYQLSPLSILFRLSHRERGATSLDKMLQSHLEMATSGNHADEADRNVFLLHILRLMQSAGDQLCAQWISHVKRLVHIVMFNVNDSSLEEMKSPQYFDHSHLFQLVQLCQLMFANRQS